MRGARGVPKTPMARSKDITKPSILDAAQALLESRGFNGFSTRELADELGISSASLHHHFATKGDLAAAVIARGREQINAQLAVIAAEVEGFGLRVQHFHEAMQSSAMLLAMCAADFPTLPNVAQNEVRQVFANVLGWLGRFATQARSDGELDQDASVEAVAAEVLSLLLGKAMLSRTETAMELSVAKSAWAWQR